MFRFCLIIENTSISLLVCRLRTVIDMQVFPFTLSFPITQHEVQTTALRKHKSRVNIYQYKEDFYQKTEVTRHNNALNFACKLKLSLNQFVVKPAVSFSVVPAYCSTVVHRMELRIMLRKVLSGGTCCVWWT